ncbi:MAG: hypothetical protein SGI88_02325 [Candidatus Hydrogenedentes bacterium]|nr:hypothetical protein [Candidatus Hydrogenedentota bacterium]
MSIDKFLYLLAESKLFLCRADNLMDAWEGAVLQSHIRTMLPAHWDLSVRGEIGEIIQGYSRQMRKCTYLNCWHINNIESAAMWDACSKKSDSIALRTNVGRLKRSITTSETLMIGEVRYADYESDESLGTLETIRPFFAKRKCFEHERELRLIIQNCPIGDDSIGWDDTQDYMALDVNLLVLIEAVFVSPYAEKWLVSPLEKILNRMLDSAVPVHRSQLFNFDRQ